MKILIIKIGNTITLNEIVKNKLINTFTFSELDLLFKEDSKRLFKSLLKHFKSYNMEINIETLKYLREVGII